MAKRSKAFDDETQDLKLLVLSPAMPAIFHPLIVKKNNRTASVRVIEIRSNNKTSMAGLL